MADSITSIFSRMEKRSAAAASKISELETPKNTDAKSRQLWLPGFDLGAFPNHLNRSSLFAPIARGKRKMHNFTKIVTREDCFIEYSGEQLDEADADLMMTLIWYGRGYGVGDFVPVSKYELLKKMERSTGKHDYEWLHRRMKSFTVSTLYIETKRYRIGCREKGEPEKVLTKKRGPSAAFHMVERFIYTGDPIDDNDSHLYNGLEPDTYYYSLNPDWVTMFSNKEFSLPDWTKRMSIGRGHDLAKALQRLVATSSNKTQYYALDWLKTKMEYGGRMRDFKEALGRAVAELQRLDIIQSGAVEVSTKGNEQLTMKI